ncbi:MAG: alpha-E domain-containing protein [Anaerolinea sp.]|nr:alpha-E domain-containing protein [Anaerolinea sp.]
MLSRVADSLYWMSRYMERAEHTARLLDLQLHLMLDLSPASAAQRWDRVLESLHVPLPGTNCDAYTYTELLTFDAANPNSIAACIGSARENARHVREQISSEMWEHVNRLSMQVRGTNMTHIWDDQPHKFFQTVKDGCHLFQGITDSTMTHGESWQFIQIGRAVERATATARLLETQFQASPNLEFNMSVSEDFLEWVGLLKSCTAFEAYCKVYTADLRPNRIAEFLILNPDFPHSVRFAVNSLTAALQAVAQVTESKRAKSVNRLAGRLRAAFDYGQIDEIVMHGLNHYLNDVREQCEYIHTAIYDAYIVYPVDELVS